MPFYEYKCASCGHTFEKMLSVDNRNEPVKEECPSCGEKAIEIVIGAVPNKWNCSSNK